MRLPGLPVLLPEMAGCYFLVMCDLNDISETEECKRRNKTAQLLLVAFLQKKTTTTTSTKKKTGFLALCLHSFLSKSIIKLE